MTKTPPDRWLSVAEILSLLLISRSTLDQWRKDGKFPDMIRLTNGTLRIRESVLNAWIESLPEV